MPCPSLRPFFISRTYFLPSGHVYAFNKRLYRQRWRIENAFNWLKDFRRIATRYDRLALNYQASVCLAAVLVWWI